MGNPSLIPPPFRRLLFRPWSPRPSLSLPFSLNLRLTHEHTETMRKTKRMLKGLQPDRHEKGECATACKMYTRTCIPLARLREGTPPLPTVCTETVCACGRINPFAALHLPEKRPGESAWRVGHLVHSAWLELQNRIAKVTGKKPKKRYTAAVIFSEWKNVSISPLIFFFSKT